MKRSELRGIMKGSGATTTSGTMGHYQKDADLRSPSRSSQSSSHRNYIIPTSLIDNNESVSSFIRSREAEFETRSFFRNPERNNITIEIVSERRAKPPVDLTED